MTVIVPRNLNLNYYCNKRTLIATSTKPVCIIYTVLIRIISDERKSLTKNSHTVSQIIPQTNEEHNHQTTRRQHSIHQKKKRNRLFSTVGESLGIRNSSGNQEKRKIDSGPKRTKLVLYKTYIVFFLSCTETKLNKIKIRIFNKIIVQNSVKIGLCKQNCFTKNKFIVPKISITQNFKFKSFICGYLDIHCCIISQNHKRRQLLLYKLRLGSSLLRNSLIVPRQTVACQTSVLTHGIM